MARGPRYKVPRRRRREGKTNYRKRYIMILSGKPRFVVRFTNKYVWVQVIKATPKGDITIAAAHSRELVKKMGWRGGTNNTCATYLTAMLAAFRALREGVNYAVLDIGLRRAVRGARVFAALKGALDAGVNIPHSDEVLPDEARIECRHIANYALQLKEEDPDRYKRLFSHYLVRGLEPENIVTHFNEIKNKIMEEYRAILQKEKVEEAVMQ